MNIPPEQQPVQYVPQAAPYYPFQPPYAPAYAVLSPEKIRRKQASRTITIMSLLYLAQSGVAMLFQLALSVMGINLLASAGVYWASTMVLLPLSTVLPFAIYMASTGVGADYFLHFEKVKPGTALLCVLAGLGVCLTGNFPAIFLQNFLGNFGFQSGGGMASTTGWEFTLELVAVAFLPAVMEEFVFRGVILGGLRRYGVGVAVVASSLIFAFAHGDIASVIFAFVAGLAMGYLYARTGNLWLSVAVHFLNNLLSVLGDFSPVWPGLSPEMSSLCLFIVPMVIGLLALVLVLVFKRRELFPSKAVRYQAGELPSVPGAAAICCSPGFWIAASLCVAYTFLMFL